MKNNNLIDFLTSYSLDSSLQTSYEQNPKQVMDSFGLTHEEMEIVNSRSASKLKSAILKNLKKDNNFPAFTASMSSIVVEE